MDNYSNFINKLNLFIDKYYRIQFFKGLIISFISLLLLFVLANILEYVGHFSSIGRLSLLLIFAFTNFTIFFYFLLIPLLRWFNVLPRMSFFKAHRILKQVFLSIDDSILNILELQDQLTHSTNNTDLLKASISQKIISIDDITFSDSISLKSINFLLPYLLGVVLILLTTYLTFPKVYKESSERLIHFNQSFVKPQDYYFNYQDNYRVYRNSNVDFRVNLTGNDFPSEIIIVVGTSNILMQRINDSTFIYSFKNINQAFSFSFHSDKYTSKTILVNITDVPTLRNFKLNVSYPSYIAREDEELEGIYDLIVPQGTDLQFVIDAIYTDSVHINYDESRLAFIIKNDNFVKSISLNNDLNYAIDFHNSLMDTAVINDKIISVVKDQYPLISVDSISDKIYDNIFHYKILVSDDYGLTQAYFHTQQDSIKLPLNVNRNKQEIYFTYDFSKLKDSLVSYYFTITDNDEYNGSKITRSNKLEYRSEKFIDLVSKEEKLTKALEHNMLDAKKLVESLQEDITKLKISLLSEKLEEWEKADKLKNLHNKQKELEAIIKDLEKQSEKVNKRSQNSELSEEIKFKQEELKKNIDNLLNDEIKQLLEELNKLNEEFINTVDPKMFDQLELNYEELSEKLDNDLEKLRKYEIEKNIERIAEEFKALALEEKQNSDSNYTTKDEFNFLEDYYDSLLLDNNELESPLDMDNFDSEFNSLNESYEDGGDKEDRSDKLQDLGDKMKDMLSNSNSNQEGENSDNLRLLLDNLFYFSFSQEQIIIQLKYLSYNNPKYISLQKEQLGLAKSYAIIKDSLDALSKRSDYIGNTISDNAFKIQNTLVVINSNLSERKRSLALTSQQYVLTYTNDLILLLSESLKNMDQASGSGSGKSSKKKQKPKNGEPSLSDLRKSQEDMKGALEKMIQDMQNGKSSGSSDKQGQMGKMLMQQEMFQQQLNELLNSDGISSDLAKQLNEIKRLTDQNKKDIIDMNVNNNFYFRQQNIMTRLLEAENSEMERGEDKERESEENRVYKESESKKYFEQYKEKTNFNEIIKRDDVQLEQFYKELFNGYVNKINAN